MDISGAALDEKNSNLASPSLNFRTSSFFLFFITLIEELISQHEIENLFLLLFLPIHFLPLNFLQKIAGLVVGDTEEIRIQLPEKLDMNDLFCCPQSRTEAARKIHKIVVSITLYSERGALSKIASTISRRIIKETGELTSYTKICP